MWKCASRTVIATLNKRILNYNTVLSTKAPQEKEFKCLLKFAPLLIEHFNRYYGFCKTTCGSFTGGNRDKDGPRGRPSFLRNFESNVFDALTWGSAIILSYYYLQPFQRKRLSSAFDNCRGNEILSWDAYQKAINYLLYSFGIRPFNNVLPEVQAAKENYKCEAENYNGLEKAHKKVMGTLHNWGGIRCMQSGKERDALMYFARAAEGENPAGIFNLGICHEKGLGTSQNYKKAAELYQRAADLGHATAMYNLGVFYVQGLAGHKPDMNHARELFKAAASLGQKDAKKALIQEKQSLGEFSGNEFVSKDVPKVPERGLVAQLISDVFSSSSNSREKCEHFNLKSKDINCDSFELSKGKKRNSTFDSDSGVVDLSPHNESDILLT